METLWYTHFCPFLLGCLLVHTKPALHGCMEASSPCHKGNYGTICQKNGIRVSHLVWRGRHYGVHFIGKVGKLKIPFWENLKSYKPPRLRGRRHHGHFLHFSFEHVLYQVSRFLHWINSLLQPALIEKTTNKAPSLQTSSIPFLFYTSSCFFLSFFSYHSFFRTSLQHI